MSMKTNSLPKELVAVAVAAKSASANFKKQAREFMQSVPDISPERFWEIATTYRELYTRASQRKCDPAEHAAHELMRQAWVGSGGQKKMTFQPNSMAEAAAFVKQYERLKDNLATALDKSKLDWDRGDDSFDDLCDALPLAGRAVCDKILAVEYKTTNDLYLDVIGTRGGGAKSVLSDVILEGENYIEMQLRDAFVGALKSAAQSEGVISTREITTKNEEEGDGSERAG